MLWKHSPSCFPYKTARLEWALCCSVQAAICFGRWVRKSHALLPLKSSAALRHFRGEMLFYISFWEGRTAVWCFPDKFLSKWGLQDPVVFIKRLEVHNYSSFTFHDPSSYFFKKRYVALLLSRQCASERLEPHLQSSVFKAAGVGPARALCRVPGLPKCLLLFTPQ